MITEKQAYCNGNLISYNKYCVILRQVVININKSSSFSKGGENISEVISQKEQDELIETKPGFFQMHCDTKPNKTFFNKVGHLKNWADSLEITSKVRSATITEDLLTIAIVRYDYANLYWVMVDVYNIFFITSILEINPENIHILIVDTHPISIVDKIWTLLFPKVTSIGHYGSNDTIMFKTLLWGLHRGESPLLKNGNFRSFPFLEEFRNFVLLKTSYRRITHPINCYNLTITIVLRRDYVAHPRNPSGKVGRKIANEIELLNKVSIAFRNHSVRGIQLDHYTVDEQIRLTSQTDILVGMHGAGLSHVLFIPKHASLIELFPSTYSTISHFEFIARWRRINYFKWKNLDRKMEVDKYTTKVDVKVVTDLLLQAQKRMCS
ncbi:uncharacterized protein LOC132750353 [Ruditapes philippinarum]|uniref:uncharacterized protein LOC132750353 n=1 Tax=Ruditapes philippinarum TaxID=129788 RepID=UPI00295B6714|nr:uncharacterized protein LOC132750353 [Ruditapes philippinarum]